MLLLGRPVRRPYVLWLGRCHRFNVHHDDFCWLCFTIGPFAFRWHR